MSMITRRDLAIGISAIPLFMSRARLARAEPHIDLNRGQVQPMPIAIPVFGGGTGTMAPDVTGVISADLQHSGLFQPIDPKAFVDQNASQHIPPQYNDWRVINAQALVTGDIQPQPDGRFAVEFRLWDVFAEQQLTGLRYTTTPDNWRRVAHIIADAIYKRITGEDGYFDTRIVYISESGPLNKRIKRLSIMDQDSANQRFLTDGRYLVLTPRFSPTAQEITYLSYARGQPQVYLFNIDTGQQEALGNFPGMTFAPRFAPDGNSVLMSLAANGATQIYSLDLRTRRATQITNTDSIDTSPCYSPDSSQVVFNSDRGGSQQLYVMNSDGSNIHRISFGNGRYGTPVWSPRGDLIAFTKFDASTFYIGVMHPDGSGERLLTQSFLVEGPTWAPNGRVMAYFRQQPMDARGGGGQARIYSIDLTGYNERELVTPQDASDPAWSPLIP